MISGLFHGRVSTGSLFQFSELCFKEIVSSGSMVDI